MAHPTRRKASLDEFWAIPEARRFHELIGGELVEKASPSGEHGDAQAGVIAAVRGPFQRRTGGGSLGGWWIQTEVEVQLVDDVVRPDVVGWRRETCPDRPVGFPILHRPDWVCEIVSPNHAANDTVTKLRLYHRNRIAFYWLVDPRASTLTAMRWGEEGYITVLSAERGEVVRAPPFEAIEIAVGTLFGDDP